MYNQYFGLSESPFSIAPNPKYLYLGHRHQEALAHLSYGVIESSGFVSLTGEVGTGKTTLCRRLLDETPEDIEVALVFNPRLSALELVATVCDELRVPYPKKHVTIKNLIDALNQHLLQTHATGKRTVLIIDEAQNLSVDVLEQVRLLSNLETNQHKLLRIMLIGQPELRHMLAKPELRQLNQRVTARYHLRPLTLPEVEIYIGHRLLISGTSRALFTKPAIKIVFRFSEGTPRLINIICDRALIGAYSKDKLVVDKKIATQAAMETMDVSSWGSHRTCLKGITQKSLILPLITFLFLTAAWAIWALSNDMINNPGLSMTAADPEPHVTKPPIHPGMSPIANLVSPKSSNAPNHAENALKTFSIQLVAQGTIKQRLVFEQLFSLWKKDYRQANGKTFCAKARSLGLQCLKKRGKWDLIRQFNRPILIQLTAPNHKSHYLLVQALPSDKVTVFLDQPYTVDFSDITSHWDGVFILLWQPPKLAHTILRQGDSGADIAWLKQHLGQTPTQQPDSELFDAALTQSVKQFQKKHFLQQDGIIGEQTLFHLVMFSPVTTDPLLQRTH